VLSYRTTRRSWSGGRLIRSSSQVEELIKVSGIIQDYKEILVRRKADGELITGSGAHQSVISYRTTRRSLSGGRLIRSSSQVVELIKVSGIIQDYKEILVRRKADGELITGSGAHQSE
jgi:hypothetical protein